MTEEDLAFADAAALQRELVAGTFSSRELVQLYLSRIEALDTRLHAWVDVRPERALAAADAMDALRRAGVVLGPLHGTVLAVKDLFDVQDWPTGAGSRATPPRRAMRTATAVRRLQQAGAIVLGKTQTVEYAFGGWGTNAQMGTPWNPWDANIHRAPGGSSSGSAVAVAAGMATLGLGTDTGGSVRIPAGLCGLVGLKTSPGLVSRHGLVALCPTHDTVGPLTHSVADAAAMLAAMAGPDPLDASTRGAPVQSWEPLRARPLAGRRLGILPAAEREGVEPDILTAYNESLRALHALGATLVEFTLPQPTAWYMGVAGELMSAEGFAHLGALFEREELAFDPHVRRRILAGRAIGTDRYLALLRERTEAIDAMNAAMDGIDLLVFPTNAAGARPVAEIDETATPLARFGRFVNLLGLSALAVPAGFSAAGLPQSVQFIGRDRDERQLLEVGLAYETAVRQQVARRPPAARLSAAAAPP